jgi:hypothetical protein
MLNLTPALALTIGYNRRADLFVLAAYFTRATRRRSAGALAGAVAYAALNILWDRLAAAVGWWVFPFRAHLGRNSPLYIPAGLVAGGAFGLIGWRVSRRWPGGRGLLVFSAGVGRMGGAARLRRAGHHGRDKYDDFWPRPGAGHCRLLHLCQLRRVGQWVLRLVAGPAESGPLARARPLAAHEEQPDDKRIDGRVLAGVAGLLVFLTVHHFWISPSGSSCHPER